MMKMLSKIAFIFCLILGSQSLQLTFAASSSNPHLTGPHGGQIVTEKGQTYEVIENKKERTIDVYLLDQSEEQREQTLSLTLPFQTTSDSSIHENRTVHFKKVGTRDSLFFYQAPLPSSVHILSVSDLENKSNSSRPEPTRSSGLSSYDERMIQRVPD
jgi:hypothetical protein